MILAEDFSWEKEFRGTYAASVHAREAKSSLFHLFIF